MRARKLICLVGLLFVLVSACSKSSLSQRDGRREQMRNTAESKRRELEMVEGSYLGLLAQSSGSEQNISVDLQIKDIPQPVDGEVDPVPTPVLTGFLRILLGDGPDEFVGFGIDKAEFDPKRGSLNIVCSNEQAKEMILALVVNGTNLSGSWTAPKVSASGTILLQRRDGSTTPDPTKSLKGTYQGDLVNTHPDSNLPDKILLSFVTSQDLSAPNGVRITGSVRLYLGPWTSNEFVEMPFSDVQYNLFTQKFVAKTSGDYKLTLKGQAKEQNMIIRVATDALGEVGYAEVSKQ